MKTKAFLATIAALIALLVPGALALADTTAYPSPDIGSSPQTSVTSRERTVFGSDLTIDAGETVGGPVTVFGGNLTSNGSVDGAVTVVGGNATVNGPVSGTVTVTGGNLSLGGGADVNDDVTVIGGRLSRAAGARVGGVVDVRSGLFHSGANRGLGWFLGSIVGAIIAISLLAAELLILVLFPHQVETVGTALERRALLSGGMGCLGTIAAIALMGLFAITIILIPLSLLMPLVMIVVWLLGVTAVNVVVGRRVLRALNSNTSAGSVAALVVGAVLVFLLTSIPVLGFLIALALGFFAFGAALITRLGTRPPAVPWNGTPPPPPPDPAAAAVAG